MPKWTEEQKQAINEKGKNIIVSAGAGSGKTAVLSERVLTHVKNGINIDDMLILTFTNAAAAEMKERIRKKISSVPELKEQLDKIDLAYITTFDAYSLSIVKKYNHILNISKKISIIDESVISLKKREILSEIFENLYEEKNENFLNFVQDFCLKDDKEIFEAVLSINNKMDNLYNKIAYLKSYIKNNYTDEKLNGYFIEYLEMVKAKIFTIKAMINNLEVYVEYEYIEKLLEVLLPLFNSTTYEQIKNNIKVKLPALPKGAVEEAKSLKKEISNMIKVIQNFVKYEDENSIKLSILKTKKYCQVIIEIILELDNRINLFKQQNDAYEFIDISKMAIKILEENEDVRKEIKNKYKEILIDEYQDTNDLQDLFVSYIENNNVYMVGDIKQSIYRFRNANPLLFKEKYDNYSMLKDGIKIDLNKNFRSRKEVTNNINLIFNLIMNNDIGGADYFSSHQMIFGNTAYDLVNSVPYDMEILNYNMPCDKLFSKEEIEIFAIARDIQQKVKSHYKVMDKQTMQERDISYEDFVILMDRSTSFEIYKKIFEYLNIPLSIYRDTKVSDSLDIMLIKNIYNLIISINERKYDTNFKYSFMSIARSYLFNMDDSKIFKIIKNNNFYKTEIYEKCKNISLNLDIYNNKQILQQIINDFNFYEKIIETGNVENHLIVLDSISKIVNNVSGFGYDSKMFLEYLSAVSKSGIDIKLSLNKESNNAVKIMTIHASKGLEYHVCYFSGLYKKFNIDDLKNKFYFSSNYGILTPYIDGGIKNTILKTLLKQKYLHEEISEKLRLFYVALTRAREKIIIVGSFTPNLLSFKENGVINDEIREKYLSFNDILCSVYNFIEPYMTQIDIDKLEMTKEYNLTKKSNYKDNLKIVKKIEVQEYDNYATCVVHEKFSKTIEQLQTKEERQNIILGLEMHELLEHLDFSNPDYTGIDNYKIKKIKKFIDCGILANSINLYKEYEFIYECDGKQMHGIIDLLIEYKNKYAIVDYKLKNTKEEAYVKQLTGYKNYIESISKKPVEIYLYSIIEEKLVKLN